MKIHVLQHVPFEDEAAIGIWAEKHGFPISKTKFFEAHPLPRLDTFDFLIIMGGPMGVGDQEIFPWLQAEKKLICDAIRARKKVLGICLGGQLIAEVLGGAVTKAPQKEIGWFPVTQTGGSDGNSPFRDLPEKFLAFHWHGDTFSIPKGAVCLAESKTCPHQAFQYQEHVLALQFHVESTLESIEKIFNNCRKELQQSKAVQRKEEILNQAKFVHEINGSMEKILNQFLSLSLR